MEFDASGSLFTADEIAAAVHRLAGQIAEDHRGQPRSLVGVLKGALYVTADLARALAGIPDGPSEIIVDYICVPATETQPLVGRSRMLKDAGGATCRTERRDRRGYRGQRPHAGLPAVVTRSGGRQACVAASSSISRTAGASTPDRLCRSTIPDEFVVGYGLDYQELFRNLPYLAQLRPAVFKEG